MTKTVRILLLACASVASLAVVGGALAAFTPTLSVSAKPARPGASGVTSIRLTVPRDDDALARIQIFVPASYTATLNQPVNTELGSVTAQVRVREPVEGAVIPVTGTLRVADPTALLAPTRTSTVSASVTQCTGTPTHLALWVLQLQAAGQELHVPVAVDAAPAPFAAFASHILTICLPNPNIPQAAGGAALGAKLINAQLNVRNVFSAPGVAGDHIWRAIATPWPVGAGLPVAANTREARAHLALPVAVATRVRAGRKVRGSRAVTISGTVRARGAAVAGATVRVTLGRTTRTVRTNASGAFRTTLRLRPRRYTAAIRVTVPERSAPNACSTPGPFQAVAPAIPCATETLQFHEPSLEGAPAADNTFLVASRTFRVR